MPPKLKIGKNNFPAAFISCFDDYLLKVNDTKPVNDAQEVYGENRS